MAKKVFSEEYFDQGKQMKLADILKVLKAELGTDQISEINQKLKAKGFETKFRITGPTVAHFGFTGLIKAITPEGVKVFNVNKVTLIRFDDILTFGKAKPRERQIIPAKSSVPSVTKTLVQSKAKGKSKGSQEIDDDEDYDNDDDFDAFADEEDDVIETEDFKVSITSKKMIKKNKSSPQSGSKYIPKKKGD